MAGDPLSEVLTHWGFSFDKNKLSMITGKIGTADKVLNRTAANVDRFQQGMSGFFGKAKALVGTYLGFRAVKALTSDYAAGADAVAKFATATGLSTQTYQGLIHAVQLGGSDQDNLNKAMTQLSKRALEANQGLKTQQRAFSELGVEVKGVDGKLKGADQLFLEVSDGFKVMTDESKRTGLSMQLLGRTGATLLPTMLEGSKGIKAMIAEAKKLGKVLSKEQLKAAENFNDEMLRVKSVLEGVRNQVAAKLLPTINRALRAFHTWWTEGRNAERALRALKFVAIFTAIVIGRIISATVLKHVKQFVQGIWAGVQALRAMGVAGSIAAAKVTAIFAALILIGLIIEDLVGFAQGKDSVIGRLLGDTSLASDLRKALVGLAKAAKQAWGDIGPALKESWQALKPALAELGGQLRPLAGPTFRAGIWLMVGTFLALADGIKLTASSLKGMISIGTFVVTTWTRIVGELRVGWAVAISTIKSGLTDLGKTAQLIGKALGVDLAGAAKKVGQAWDLGLKGIRTGLDALNSGLSKALRLKGLLFGVDIGSLDLEKRTKQIRESMQVVAGPTGEAVLPGLFQPHALNPYVGVGATPALPGVPASAFRGPDKGTVVTTTVAAGAVPINITGAGDGEDIAAKAQAAVAKGIAKAITDASRDIVKPPSGQS